MRKLKLAAAFISACCVLALILWQSGGATSHAQKKGKEARGAGETSVLTVPDYQVPDKFARARAAETLAPQAATATVFNEPIEDTGQTLNNTAATAQTVAAPVKIKGNLFPNGDIDFYKFTATAGSRVYTAAMTAFSPGSTDSQLTLLASDGTTPIEFDDDNGTFAGFSSSIAGATIPTTGTYYLKINDFTAGTASERPYELWLTAQTGAATPEVEPNDTPATANVLPASGFVSGARNPALATEQDWYSFALNAGDTVYLGMDLDPERDGVTYNGRLGLGLFGDAGNQILVVDDAGTGDVTPNPNIPSEALFMTVRTAGTYYVFADSATAAVGGPTATYNISVTVLPRIVPAGVTCATYPSLDTPLALGPGATLTTSNITVPASAARIASIRPTINLTHTIMNQLDVHLRSPAGNDNGLFTDIGAAATGGQTTMNTTYDDEAGITPGFTVFNGLIIKPELNYRLAWFKGENPGGVWSLDLRDDTADTNGGTLNSWSLEVCTEPLPLTRAVFYNETFESGAGGYTHSGTADEWQLGTPATAATTTANPVAAFTTCNSGTQCWKTDLTGTYEVNSSQNLVSPSIGVLPGTGPLVLSWAMRYQMESANFDHANVRVTEVGNPANTRVVWQFLDGSMIDAPGNPVVNIGASAGWGTTSADISDFAGKNVQITFHLDSDPVGNFGGLAIDDVRINALAPTAAEVTVGGRISTGRKGVAGARVTMTDAAGARRFATTDANGNYSFANVAAGETYIFQASSRKMEYAPRVVNVTEDVSDLNFTSQ